MVRIERALVTGASSGIGRAIAVELARRGSALVLVARDERRLEDLATLLRRDHGVEVEVLSADLTDDVDRRRVEQRVADLPLVDCVVNNAGTGPQGPLAASTPDVEEHAVVLDVLAVARLTQVAAMTFRPRGHGAILNVSSLASFQPTPGFATYGASKAFVTSLTEAVHEELRDTGVRVTALCPGYTRTEFHDRAAWDVGGLPDVVWGEAEDVAVAALDALDADRAVVVPGAANAAVAGLARGLPDGVVRRLAAALLRVAERRRG